MRAIIKLTHRLYKKYSNEGEIGANLAFACKLPLSPPPSPYPVFDSFPKYVVEEKELLREKIIR